MQMPSKTIFVSFLVFFFNEWWKNRIEEICQSFDKIKVSYLY